jgi:hypothetical protein
MQYHASGIERRPLSLVRRASSIVRRPLPGDCAWQRDSSWQMDGGGVLSRCDSMAQPIADGVCTDGL